MGLRARFEEDGYLFLPGFLDREEVREVRRGITDVLTAEGLLDPAYPAEQAVAREGLEMYFRPDIANASDALKRLIYSPRVLGFYEDLFGEPVRHYDYTWMRAIAPGKGTQPHCDIVYMGRGTPRLSTAWVPLGDVPLEVGGLIVLESSHRLHDLKRTYGSLDVDALCEGETGRNQLAARGYLASGAISGDPAGLREVLGGRWLTAEYRMGDLLAFSPFLVHGSLDNGSRQIRLSSDSRYQPASEPADERWVGESPVAHGPDAKKGLIC